MNTESSGEWGSRRQIHVLALMAITALGLYLCYLMVLPFVPALTWALALAVLFMPVQRWLELRLLVHDDRGADRHGFYLLSITRSRSDGTVGLKGSLLRPVISRRSRNAIRGYLEHLKRQVDSAVTEPY